ncbi:lantibiotic modifying enzyme [Providencia alcalifaciens]|nr:lantibiotic modifying enzyme [Providencia alcalifaciens]
MTMNSSIRTLEALLKQYPDAKNIVKKISGVYLDDTDYSIPYHQRFHFKQVADITKYLSYKLKSYSITENIYPILCEHLYCYFNEMIKNILIEFKGFIKNTDLLSESLAKQGIDSLSDAVKQLCFLCTTLNQSKNYRIENWGNIFTTYPVIFEKITTHEAHLKMVVKDIFSKIKKDKIKLQNKFNIMEYIITSVELFLGDFHQVGEGIIKVMFKNSTLVYKPRNANNEEIVSKLLIDIYESKNKVKIGIPNYISIGNYSWHEFIKFKNPKTKNEIIDFYSKIGSALAFFHCLNGTDFHFENIICYNDTPYFIDLECVFICSPHFSLLSNSVLRTFIIPTLQGNFKDHLICGIGERDTNNEIPTLKTLEISNENKVYHKSLPYKSQDKINRPIDNMGLSNESINKVILAGFDKMVNLLKKKKTIIKKLRQTNKLKGRMLFRATKTYGNIISISDHPAYSSDPTLRDAYIACILYNEDFPINIIRQEYLAIKDGRIPLFYVDIINEIYYSQTGDEIYIEEKINSKNEFISKKL